MFANDDLKAVHFIGIGGIGMSALAHILLDQDCKVSGSDNNARALEDLINRGAECHVGHKEEHVPLTGIVVYSSSIAQDNIEYQTALKRGLILLHRSQLLAELIKNYTSILISGSHGKTTTSSMLTYVLQKCGEDVSYAIGGHPFMKSNGYSGKSSYFIAEADESDDSLKSYAPKAVIVTNLDDEHLINYGGDRHNLGLALNKFIQKVSDKDLIFYGGDCKLLQPFVKDMGYSFGFESSNDLEIYSFEQIGWESLFSFRFLGKEYKDFSIPMPGKHNVLNAAAVCGMALSLGFLEEEIKNALATFPGVKRRLEKKNISNRFLLLDDYAHHPKEIKSTLESIRKAIVFNRLIAVFQPHRYTRLQSCYKEFLSAFASADLVIVTDVYNAGEEPFDGFSMEDLICNIKEMSCTEVIYIPFDELENTLKQTIVVHDVCVLLGAGSITLIGDRLTLFEPSKLSVGLVYGGQSCEHNVSILSCGNISTFLDRDLYDLSYFFIDKLGLWHGPYDHLVYEDITKDAGWSPVQMPMGSVLDKIELFFPVLHGPNGEDGSIQGLFEMIHKPYCGPDISFAAIGHDKALARYLVMSHGIKATPFIEIFNYEWKVSHQKVLDRITSSFEFPVVVKSPCLGSSLGIEIAFNIEDLKIKIPEIFRFDERILIEENKLGCREIEFACLGDVSQENLYMAEPYCRGQGEFIDYESKYGLNGVTAVSINKVDNLSDEVKAEGKLLARRIYQVLGGNSGFRIDFFLDEHNNYWFSEVNTIPGMTKKSLFLKAFEENGLGERYICNLFITHALYRFRKNLVCDSSQSTNKVYS